MTDDYVHIKAGCFGETPEPIPVNAQTVLDLHIKCLRLENELEEANKKCNYRRKVIHEQGDQLCEQLDRIKDLEQEIKEITALKDAHFELNASFNKANSDLEDQCHRYKEALEFISIQFCQRFDDQDCLQTGDCVTEYCLACYAKAHMKALKTGGGND